MAKNTTQTTEVFVTKLESARRQIDAAVRMTFGNEDTLAIHTVAAAGYAVLRDIKRQRGRSEMGERFRAGIYQIAYELASSTRSDIPDSLKDSKELVALIREFEQLIRAGDVKNINDIHVSAKGENHHWRSFNMAANFLKHADLDANNALNLADVDNENLLANACASYGDILNILTPEMETFLCNVIAKSGKIGVGWSVQFDDKFRKLSHSRQRNFCLKYIRDIKREAKSKQTDKRPQ